MPHILVVGTLSLDVLHLPPASDAAPASTAPMARTVHTVGGAGLYTALAARAAGAEATLLAPRAPAPPGREALWRAVHERVRWIGPDVTTDALPRLEIAHHGHDRATLLDAQWGGEAELVPSHLPPDLQQFDAIHIAALSSAQKQRAFVDACRAQRSPLPSGGPRQQQDGPQLSAGTYARLVQGERESVRALFEAVDYAFLNENEANGLLDFHGDLSRLRTSSAQLLFVTQGKGGAWVVRGKQRTHVAAQAVRAVDPTGAGDTFCGATLAGLAAGQPPTVAAEQAASLAARAVLHAGPAALLRMAG